jgi:hypothetical protein
LASWRGNSSWWGALTAAQPGDFLVAGHQIEQLLSGGGGFYLYGGGKLLAPLGSWAGSTIDLVLHQVGGVASEVETWRVTWARPMPRDQTGLALDTAALFVGEISAALATTAAVLAVIPGVDVTAVPVGTAAAVTSAASTSLAVISVGYSATQGGVYVGDGRVFLSGAMGESLATLGLATALSPPVLAGPRCEGPWGPLGWAPAS